MNKFIAKYNSFFDMKNIFLILLITIMGVTSCSKDSAEVENINNKDTITKAEPVISIDSNRRRNRIESVDDQIKQLNRIIGINKAQLEKYEKMIAVGDTFDLKGLPLYVEDLKKAIKLKEERLAKLKKK